jgi:hypothetical protein
MSITVFTVPFEGNEISFEKVISNANSKANGQMADKSVNMSIEWPDVFGAPITMSRNMLTSPSVKRSIDVVGHPFAESWSLGHLTPFDPMRHGSGDKIKLIHPLWAAPSRKWRLTRGRTLFVRVRSCSARSETLLFAMT